MSKLLGDQHKNNSCKIVVNSSLIAKFHGPKKKKKNQAKYVIKDYFKHWQDGLLGKGACCQAW